VEGGDVEARMDQEALAACRDGGASASSTDVKKRGRASRAPGVREVTELLRSRLTAMKSRQEQGEVLWTPKKDLELRSPESPGSPGASLPTSGLGSLEPTPKAKVTKYVQDSDSSDPSQE
jgi:hypothetical protein